jgi:hypothetical protein
MDSFDRRYQRLKQEADAPTTLDAIAGLFLFCGFCFWGVAFWQLLAPPAILSLLSIQAVVLALAFAFAAPLLLSMLVPTTPAGQLLQKTQWATIGFYVILFAAIYLTFQAEQLIEMWLSMQPGVAEAHFERRLALVLTIAFVVVPALAWVQLSPEKWANAVQQAHAVKKLELQQQGELAIVKASLVRAETLAAIGWANLLPLEKEEAIKSLRGLLMASSDSMRSIVRTMNVSADLERSIMGDEEIAGVLDYVTQGIDIVPEIDRPAAHVDSRSAPSESRALIAAPAASTPAAHVDSRSGSSESREAPSDQARPSRTQSDQVYDAIARDLPPVFTATDVSDRMQWTDKREGQRVIRAWLDEGAAKEVRLGRYSLTDRGGAQ